MNLVHPGVGGVAVEEECNTSTVVAVMVVVKQAQDATKKQVCVPSYIFNSFMLLCGSISV